MGVPEKIKKIEEEMRKTQINKATEHHLGLLKAKIAKLRRDQEDARSRGKSGSTGYDIKKSGDATVAIVGLPNVGKSTLLNKLTKAKSKVGGYRFTTLTVVPGVMEYKGAPIQILDLPGLIEGASSGKGFGKRILSVARSADLILFVLDVFQPDILSLLLKEVRGMGIRPDDQPPNVIIEKTMSGGISVNCVVKLTKMSTRLVKDILHVYGVRNGRIVIREDIVTDQLIDILQANRVYIPSLTVLNKIDLVNSGFITQLKSKLNHRFIPVSGDSGINLEVLKETIYNQLNFIRIYMRPKGGVADYEEPLIVKNGALVMDVCNKIHRGLKDEFRWAQVWGKSAKFGGQKVSLKHSVMDEDVITLITK